VTSKIALHGLSATAELLVTYEGRLPTFVCDHDIYLLVKLLQLSCHEESLSCDDVQHLSYDDCLQDMQDCQNTAVVIMTMQ